MRLCDIDCGKVGRTACSLLLVAGLCWPYGLAFAGNAAETSQEVLETVADQAAVEAEAVGSGLDAESNVGQGEDGEIPDGDSAAVSDAVADPAGGQSLDAGGGSEGASDGDGSAEGSDRDADAILDAAREMGLAGVDALERYLDGGDLSDEELLSIDVDALYGIDEGLASEIEALQADARERVAAAEVDGAQLQDAKPSGGSKEEAAAGESARDAEGKGADGGDLAESAAKASAKEEGKAGDGQLQAASFSGELPAADDAPQYPAWSYSGDTTLVSRSFGVSLTTSKFVAVIGEQARELAAEHDLYASVMIAQAIVESGSGNSALAQAPNFNLFGIKGSYEGQSVTMGTQEDDGTGALYAVDAAFCRYPSYRESLEDYADLLSRPLYLPARKSATKSFAEACDYLEGTYATSTSYSETLKGVIVAYDLTRYDEPLGYELAVPCRAVVDADTGEQLGVGAAALAEWADELERQEREGAAEGERALAVEDRGLADLAAAATSELGSDYVWGAAGPGEFDCSGLVQSSYARALGVALPRTTHYQCLLGEDVDFRDLRVGDLVFFARGGDVYHVGMYLGEGCYIESTVPGGVQVTAMEERTPAFAKRVLPLVEVEKEDDALERELAALKGACMLTKDAIACVAARLELAAEEAAEEAGADGSPNDEER